MKAGLNAYKLEEKCKQNINYSETILYICKHLCAKGNNLTAIFTRDI